MIYLKRPPAPRSFKSPKLHAEREFARTFFANFKVLTSQDRFDWSRTIRLLREATKDLCALSTNKCAYCETLIGGPGSFNLEHFRPKAQAIGRTGSVSGQHYWWLAFEWNNLLPACQACNVAKATRFPVSGQRAPLGASGPELDAEQPLLLDPCRDDPAAHLIFDEEGRVAPVTERGETTIEVLALNRESLTRSRQEEIHLFRQMVGITRSKAHSVRNQHLDWYKIGKRFLARTRPFLGAKRQLFALWIGEAGGDALLARVRKALGPLFPARIGEGAVAPSRELIASAKDKFQAKQEKKERHSVEAQTPAARSAYFSGQRRLERIVLKNFKGVRDLELSLPPPSTERQSWLMLVGENATGKSSILQAVALALIGQKHIGRMGLDARDFVTRGQAGGSVQVHLTNVSRPVELSFGLRERQFRIDPPSELVLLLGYGATRLLPRSATTKNVATRYVRVKNLFNPYARLQDAERWLTNRRLVKDALFNQCAVALKRLLVLDDNCRFIRERTRVKIEVGGELHGLRSMSDGYQSVAALAMDIMMGLVARWPSIEAAEGIVLIDELETHLHPRWKMEIVSRLRLVFPKLTFIATTHDPLCLRGLEPGEIVVLRKRDGNVEAQTIQESVAHLRADQLLTSELFGLYSTRGPKVCAAIQRHTELSSKPLRSTAEEQELEALDAELAGKLSTAETPAEREAEDELQSAVEDRVLPALEKRLGSPQVVGNLSAVAQQALRALLQPRPNVAPLV